MAYLPVSTGNVILADTINALGSASAWFSPDSGGTDAYELTFNGGAPNYNNVSSLSDGQFFTFLAGSSNTGAATLQINALTALPLTKNGGESLVAGDIESDQLVVVVYNSAGAGRFELLGTSSTSLSDITPGSLGVPLQLADASSSASPSQREIYGSADGIEHSVPTTKLHNFLVNGNSYLQVSETGAVFPLGASLKDGSALASILGGSSHVIASLLGSVARLGDNNSYFGVGVDSTVTFVADTFRGFALTYSLSGDYAFYFLNSTSGADLIAGSSRMVIGDPGASTDKVGLVSGGGQYGLINRTSASETFWFLLAGY